MAKERDLQLDSYGISKLRYRELKYFCLQYIEMKEKLSQIRSISATSFSGLPSGNAVGSPTERKAIKAAEISSAVELIEQTALEADGSIYQYLLKNVTEGIPYEYMPVPCGRRYFYTTRRKFFYLLSEKKGN